MNPKQDVFSTMNEFYTYIEDIWIKFRNFNKQIIDEYNENKNKSILDN